MKFFSWGRAALAIALLLALDGGARAQGVLSDILSGNLVDPEVGAYSWYHLKDSGEGANYRLRQAIVGEERVRFRKGYWVEVELVPELGFPVVYKFLLTGPANRARNVHRILVKQGEFPVREMEIDPDADADSVLESAAREPAGVEIIETESGPISAERFTVDSEDGRTEVWISPEVRPTGIVKLVSPEGELVLKRHGVGGIDGLSAIPDEETVPARPRAAEPEPQGRRPTRNFSIRVEPGEEPPPTRPRGIR